MRQIVLLLAALFSLSYSQQCYNIGCKPILEIHQQCAYWDQQTQTIQLTPCHNDINEGCDWVAFTKMIKDGNIGLPFQEFYCTPFWADTVNNWFFSNTYNAALIDTASDEDWYDYCKRYIKNDCADLKKRYGNSTVMGTKCGTSASRQSPYCPNNPQTNTFYNCECSYDGNSYCEIAKGDQPWCEFYTLACKNLEKGNVMYDQTSYGLKPLLVDEDASLLYLRASLYNHLAVSLFKISAFT